MSVRIALCLLVVLTCYCDFSALAVIGGQCGTNDDCKNVNNTVCLGQVCTCLSNYVPASGKESCLPKAGFGEACNESVQCDGLGEAVCTTECICKNNFKYNGVICAGDLGLGQLCAIDAECFVPDDPKLETVSCSSSQCSCRKGYKRDGVRCVIGGDCRTDVGCSELGNSFCDTRLREKYFCACKEDFLPVANKTKCFPIAKEIGSGCEYDEQCSHKLGKAVCKSKQCKCAEGATQNQNNTCGIPGECLTDDDCSQLENSYCDKTVQDKYKCTCKDGFLLLANNTKCLPIGTDIGNVCEYDEQCSYQLGKAVCVNYHCKCAEGATQNQDNKCSAAVRIVLSLSCFVLVSMAKLL